MQDGDQLVFGLDLDAVQALLEDHYRTDAWPAVEAAPDHVHFLVGGASPAIDAADRRRLGDSATIVADAGHWLHIERPGAVASFCLHTLT